MIALVILAIALIIFAIRMFCKFVAWITPDGGAFRRLTVAGLLLLTAFCALFTIVPGAPRLTARVLGFAPEDNRHGRPAAPKAPARPGIGYAPGEQVAVAISHDIYSIKGHHRYRNFTVALDVLKPESTPTNPLVETTLPVTNFDTTDAGWGQTIQVPTYGERTTKPSLSVRVTLPANEALYGRSVRVRVSGTIEYPVVANRFGPYGSQRTGDTFDESHAAVSADTVICCLSREEATAYKEAVARHEDAKKRHEAESRQWDAGHFDRSRANHAAWDDAENRAREVLPFVWAGVPVCLLLVPAACLVGRRRRVVPVVEYAEAADEARWWRE